MEDNKIIVCRLCFSLISDRNFFHITGSLKDMLSIITSDLNFNVTDFPVMCSECINVVQDVFNFKANFFESEEIISSKLSDGNLKLDLVDIMNNCNIQSIYRSRTRSKKNNLCRTCLQDVKERFIHLNKRGNVTLSLMLESCLSELDLKLTTNPIMCLTCYEALQKMSMFKLKCKENECKIDAFLKTVDSKDHINVNLHSVLQFSSNCESSPNDTKKKYIKTEPNSEYPGESSIYDCSDYVMVKIESTDEMDNSVNKNKEEDTFNKIQNKVETENINQQHRTRRPDKQTRARQGATFDKTTHCSDCDFKTKYKYSLKRHSMVAHGRIFVIPVKKFYQCPHCRFSTRWNSDRTKHMLSHVKPEAFQCTRCPYSTNQNFRLVKHILTHVNEDTLD